jgi:hypothetical protein
MMKASTQLIDDLAGVGLPSDEPGIFNFVTNDHTIAVFWKPLAFFGQPMVMAQKSGRCDLRVNEYTANSRRQLFANAAIVASRVSA